MTTAFQILQKITVVTITWATATLAILISMNLWGKARAALADRQERKALAANQEAALASGAITESDLVAVS